MKILKNCLVSILLSCLFTPFNGIALTTDADGVYQISSANDLRDFAKFANENPSQQIKAVLTDDVVLNANVLNENKELNNGNFKAWTPIVHTGASGSSFDGQGHSISGLYIKDNTLSNQGLFGLVENWQLDNISIVDSYIESKLSSGLLCGTAKNCIINNIFTDGLLNFYGNSNAAVCGEFKTSSLSHTTNRANVMVYVTSQKIGGIAGNLSASSTIKYCENYGYVKYHNLATQTNTQYYGGICGYDLGNISNCTNYGDVFCGSVCGGICGMMGDNVSLSNVVNYGTITGFASVGGIIGSSYSSAISNTLNCGGVFRSNGSTNTTYGPIVGVDYPSLETKSYYLESSFTGAAKYEVSKIPDSEISSTSTLEKLNQNGVNWLLSPETNMPVPLVDVVQYFGNGAQMQTCFAPSSAFEPKDNSILLSPVALSGHNVVVQGTEGENTCEHFKLIDKEPIHVPCPFKVKSFEYNREVNPSSDVTMVLPFAVPLSAINGTVFKMESYDTSTVVFREVADSFIIPNTPYLVAVDDAATTLLQSCEDVLCSSGDLIDITCGEVTHFGAYKSTQFTTLPDITTYYGFSGGKFKKANTSLTVGPFRTAFALSPAITFDLGVIIQGKESAAPLLDNGNDVNAKVSVFDVSGRLIRSNVDFSSCLQGLRKGIYVVNGRKCVVSDTNYAAPISRNTLKSSHVVYNLIAE